MKKRIALIVLAVLMVLMLAACKSENAKMVDEKIFQLGKITLKSESKIEELEIMVENLTEKEKGQLDNLHILEKTRETYETLLEEQNLKYIGKVEDAIKTIGTVTLESEQKIKDAQNAYAKLSADEKAMVTNYQKLTDANTQYRDMKAAAEKQATLNEAKSLFRVKRIYAGSHDSVGGVYIYFDFVNLSDKPIKYVHFSFSFYNSVGDEVWDEFSQSTSCYYTGPVYKGEGTESGWRWGKYYNWNIARVELDSLWLEYMDGTKYYFSDDQIAHITY